MVRPSSTLQKFKSPTSPFRPPTPSPSTKPRPCLLPRLLPPPRARSASSSSFVDPPGLVRLAIMRPMHGGHQDSNGSLIPSMLPPLPSRAREITVSDQRHPILQAPTTTRRRWSVAAQSPSSLRSTCPRIEVLAIWLPHPTPPPPTNLDIECPLTPRQLFSPNPTRPSLGMSRAICASLAACRYTRSTVISDFLPQCSTDSPSLE